MPDGKEITFNATPDDPRVDPSSPQFDIETYFNQLDPERMSEARKRVDEHFASITEAMKQSTFPASAIDEISEMLQKITLDLAARAIAEAPDRALDIVAEFAERLSIIVDEQDPDALQISMFPEDQREQELANKALQALPRLQSIIPKKHLIPNSRLANALTDGIIDAGRQALSVSTPTAKSQIDIICDLVYEGDNLKLSGRQPFTEYDRNVYNAVASLYVYGDKSHIVTPATIYRAMTSMTATEDPSPQQSGAVTRSIEKMRFIRANINCTDQLQQRKIPLNGEVVTGGIIDTYLLNASAIQVQAGGRTIRAYQIEKPPILYAYSNMLNQVLTIPAKLLDIKAVDQYGKATSSRISNTESRIQAKGYLLRRIEMMKGKNSMQSNIISLTSYKKGGIFHRGLYEIAGLDDSATRKAQKAVRDYAEQALKYWISCGHIKGYSFVKTGQSVTGIKIDL